MVETILKTNTLPEPLFRLIQSERVKVNESNGIVSLIPLKENKKGCPIRGLCADGRLSSYTFIEDKQNEKELEN
jgi:hypothetical protein